jgi:hypothetical protein
MFCPRCSSQMAYEPFTDVYETFWGWRCIHCGEIIDQVIMNNRFDQMLANVKGPMN